MKIKHFFKHSAGWLLADLTAGAAFTLAYPPFHWLPFFWLGGVYFIYRLSQAASFKQAIWRGWWFGTGALWAAFYWFTPGLVTYSTMPAWLALIINQIYVSLMSVEYMLVGGLIWLVAKYFNSPWSKLAGITIVLAGLDVFFPEIFENDAAITLFSNPFWLQTLDIWGTAGLALILHLSVVWLWLMGRGNFNIRQRWQSTVIIVIIISLLAGYGWWAKDKWQNPPSERTVKIAGIQANISTADKQAAFKDGDPTKQAMIMDKHLSQSAAARASGAELIIWPETAVPEYINYQSNPLKQFYSQAQSLGADFIIGAFERFPNEPIDDTYNGVFYYDRMYQTFTDKYYKSVLLVGGEYTPLSDYWPKLKELFPTAPNLKSGEGPKLIDWQGVKIAPTICYEAIIPSFMQRLVGQQPQVLLNLTNDSHFGQTREPILHLSLQALRAIEYRLPLVRVANTGISAIVTPYGQWDNHLAYNQEGNLLADLPINDHQPTFYSRYGYDLTHRLLAISMLGLMVMLWRASRRQPGPAS